MDKYGPGRAKNVLFDMHGKMYMHIDYHTDEYKGKLKCYIGPTNQIQCLIEMGLL